MDDGKVNVLSQEMLAELNEALGRAEADAAIVALAGRAGVFSAGFDLKVLRAGGPDARTMLKAGFELAERMLSFPMPVVIASGRGRSGLSRPGCGGRRVRPGTSHGASWHRAVGHDGPRRDQAAGQEAGAYGHSRGYSARDRFLCRVTAFR
jgi:hypothetical protein